jgi:acyl-CoA thioester hydrolase
MTTAKLDLSDPNNYAYWWTDRIRFADTDASQHVNNVAFVAYVETGRVYFCKLVLGEDAVQGEGYIVARIAIDYLRELHWPGEVRIGAAVTKIGTRSFTVANAVFKDGVCAATAESVVVFRRGGKSAPIDGARRERLEAALPPALSGRTSAA